MDSKKLFETALSIDKPWYIKEIEFDVKEKRLDISIDFIEGACFSSKEEGYDETYEVYDTVDKTWRHLNFFDHKCFLHCRTPRIKIDTKKVRRVSPPWAGKNAGFTLLFEAFILGLCENMPVKVVSKLVNESDHKIWRLLLKYTELARKEADYSQIKNIGIDETSIKKGHNYITLVVDLADKRAIYVTEGKDHKTVERFGEDLINHKGDPKQIENVSCDMSPAYIKGIHETLPNAQITFDRYHVLKIINDAVDEVRKEEVKTNPILKHTKYVFLKNKTNLTQKEQVKLKEISLPKLKFQSVKALQIRESFQEIYSAPTEEMFVLLLKKWYFWATHCRIPPIIKAAKTIKAHWSGIIAWKKSQINNGILEGLNSIVQAAKAKARGFKNPIYYKVIIYLIIGKLDFSAVNPYKK